MNKILKTKVAFEINQIDKLLDKADPLLKLCRLTEPDFIEMSAMAAVLHSFYNGIEGIFLIVDKYTNSI